MITAAAHLCFFHDHNATITVTVATMTISRMASGISIISSSVGVPLAPSPTPPLGGCEGVTVMLGGGVVTPWTSCHSLHGPGSYTGGARWV